MFCSDGCLLYRLTLALSSSTIAHSPPQVFLFSPTFLAEHNTWHVLHSAISCDFNELIEVAEFKGFEQLLVLSI